jgi:hypothetical protein
MAALYSCRASCFSFTSPISSFVSSSASKPHTAACDDDDDDDDDDSQRNRKLGNASARPPTLTRSSSGNTYSASTGIGSGFT